VFIIPKDETGVLKKSVPERFWTIPGAKRNERHQVVHSKTELPLMEGCAIVEH
jgi:hypothetical protein